MQDSNGDRSNRPEASDAQEHEGRNQADRRAGGAGPGTAHPGLCGRESTTQHREHDTAGRAAGRHGWVDADVAHQLQREAIYSAAYMASAGTQWKDELATQRKATDAAVSQYNSTLKSVNPGKESADLAKDVSAVNSALGNLDTQRRSVDGLETPAPTAIGQYDARLHRPGPAQHGHRRLGQRSPAGPGPDHLRQPERGQGRRGQRGRPVGGARAGRPVPRPGPAAARPRCPARWSTPPATSTTP